MENQALATKLDTLYQGTSTTSIQGRSQTGTISGRAYDGLVLPALMMGMGDIILDRISFGGVKELEEIYSD